ncbi:MAG: hypothetical protein RI911_6 [Candidatus Parcubacteria bacterium]
MGLFSNNYVFDLVKRSLLAVARRLITIGLGRAPAFKPLAPRTKYVRLCFACTHYFVPGAGLEPARLFKARDLKSLASTIPPSRHIFLINEQSGNTRCYDKQVLSRIFS